MSTQSVLSNYFANELFSGGDIAVLDPDEDLISSGVIDSLALMQLAGFMKQQFGVEVEQDDITAQNFRSLNALGRMIDAKRMIQC